MQGNDKLRRRVELLESGDELLQDHSPIRLKEEWSDPLMRAVRELDRLVYVSLRRGDVRTATKAQHEINELLKSRESTGNKPQPVVYIQYEDKGGVYHQ